MLRLGSIMLGLESMLILVGLVRAKHCSISNVCKAVPQALSLLMLQVGSFVEHALPNSINTMMQISMLVFVSKDIRLLMDHVFKVLKVVQEELSSSEDNLNLNPNQTLTQQFPHHWTTPTSQQFQQPLHPQLQTNPTSRPPLPNPNPTTPTSLPLPLPLPLLPPPPPLQPQAPRPSKPRQHQVVLTSQTPIGLDTDVHAEWATNKMQ